MKNSLLTILSVFTIVFLMFSHSYSQTPQYYNYNNVGTSSNTFPLGQSAGKAVQWLFLAGDFNQPAPLPPGNMITKVWLFITTGGTRTYTDLVILMKQDTIVTLTSGTFYPPANMDTVYYKSSVTLTGPTNGWMSITLDKPYIYDPSKSLVVMIGQCAAGSGTGIYVRQNTLANIRRVWSVGGCPFTPYSGGDGAIVNFGVDVTPVPAPDLLYYKFENNPTTISTPNCANPGVGTNPASITGLTLTPGGQFDSCITGTGASGAGVNTGWNCNLGASSWTISMWVTIPTNPSGSAYYLFGDPGSNAFRCFHNGVAYPDSILLRATGMTDVRVPGTGPAPCVVTFVYDSAAPTIYAYKNGVLVRTVPQTALNLPTGTGFKVGGYSTSTSFIGKLDEFRLWKRALTPSEVYSLYAYDIACGIVTGVGNYTNQLPTRYILHQNYPNPFNPVTKISYAIPQAGFVTLKVYDLLGKEVATLVNENKVAGEYVVDFNAGNLASGIYFYRINVNGFTDTKKMMVVK